MKPPTNSNASARALAIALLALPGPALLAQESGNAKGEGNAWVKALKEGAARGSLSDHREPVRGDTGKWNDQPKLQVAPSIEGKPAGMSLDDWADQLAETDVRPAAGQDAWLIFRTRQLDDNDRVWVEKVERRGNEFTVVLNQAIWQGFYRKTFTFHEVLAVNLGKLEPGDYRAKWIVKPLEFRQFEKPAEPAGQARETRNLWPADIGEGQEKPVEIALAFTVAVP